MVYRPALDGVRGVAILLVMLHHFTLFDPSTTIGAWLGFVALLGWSGVDLFFVLSGFLITGILLDARGSDTYFTAFYARRVLRIFPLYYLVVFFSFVVLARDDWWHTLLVGDTEVVQWPYWTYLVNFAIAERGDFTHGVLDIAWSLAIEEQFYLVWPAIVWLLPPRALAVLCAVIVAAVPILRTVAVDGGTEPVDVYVLPFFRADALAIGGLLACLLRAGWSPVFARVGPWIAGGGVVAVIATAMSTESPWWWEPPMQRFGYSLLALTGAGVVMSAVARPDDSTVLRVLTTGWLRAFGKYSYAMYLFHLPISRVLQEFVAEAEEFPLVFGALWPAQVAFYAAATAATFALAWVSWRFFEEPILRLKSRFPYSETRAVSAP